MILLFVAFVNDNAIFVVLFVKNILKFAPIYEYCPEKSKKIVTFALGCGIIKRK